jgi:hypothetical protein
MLEITKKCIEEYESMEARLADRLGVLYDCIDDLFENKDESVFQVIKELVEYFSYPEKHPSEMKTMLIISKPFKDRELISDSRLKLLEIYDDV